MDKIPKKIHYCWFGRGKKPKIAKKCIKSWKKYLPDYEIIEWNEDNFDINSNLYVKQAYEAKKYAFVTDYVRLYALYNYGGIYMDTDVEVVKSLDEFLKYDGFAGFESEKFCCTGILGCKKENAIIKEFLDVYINKKFIKNNGEFDQTPNPVIFTNICYNYGLKLNNKEQEINKFKIFPQTVFSPLNFKSIETNFSENTYTIHHFAGSWLGKEVQDRIKKEKKYEKRKLFLCKFMTERNAYIILDFKWILKNKINKLIKQV